MKHWKVLVATLFVAVMLCGCGKSNDVIVTVNDKQIKAADFNKNFEKRANSPEFKQAGIDIKDEKNKPYYLLVKNQVIDEMIVMALLDEEIEQKGITVSDEDFENEYKKLIEVVGSEDQLKENLKKGDLSLDKFKKELRNELKYRKLIDKVAPVNISDKEAKTFYDQNKDKFNLPERVRASHILVSANPDEIRSLIENSKDGKGKSASELDSLVQKEMNERLEKAKVILAEVKHNPAKFAEVAQAKSDDKISAKQGGELGEFTKDQMVKEFSQAAFSQKPNTVSNIVKTPYGYHIILVQDKMAAGLVPFDKAKEQIKKVLENEKRTAIVSDYLDNIKKKAKIEYNDTSFKPESIQEEMKKFNVAARSANAPAEDSKK